MNLALRVNPDAVASVSVLTGQLENAVRGLPRAGFDAAAAELDIAPACQAGTDF